jgi:protein SCO1/2
MALLGGIVLALMALAAAGLLALVAITGPSAGGASPTPGQAAFAVAGAPVAPPLELTDQFGQPFRLTELAGRPALVFFGYTHCPDVCPTTVANVNHVLADVGPGPRAVFVSIDPARDDVAAMANYTRYLPSAYYGLSGTADEVGRAAAAWGIQYARIEQESANGYSMAHTADLFLVDAQGRLRARFPFGTEPAPVEAVVKELLRETPPPTEPPATPPAAASTTPSAAPALTPAPGPTVTPSSAPAVTPAPATQAAGKLRVTVVSTSIWAGGTTPVIVTLGDADGRPLDGTMPVSVRIVGANETPTGPDVPLTAILPMGERIVSYVADVTIPSPGSWRLDVIGADGSMGSAPINAMNQGTTIQIGAIAPDVDTPTLADTGGDLKPLTTLVDQQADERLYATSIADARKAGRPYVLVIDSNRFRVSPACGRALSMIRYLLDRWPDVTFSHLEPFVYQVITEEPVLSGSLDNPPLNQWTVPWGIGDQVWPATAMPWIFVVDGDGVVRAKYTGVVGSADVDTIVSWITGKGVLNP